MSIQDWGAIGEVIGGVGVIITLLYLSLQIRQNTKQVASTSLQNMSERIENRLMASIHNPQFAETLARGRAGEELSELERTQLGAWLTVWVSDLQDGYRQMKLGMIEESILKGRIMVISNLRSNIQYLDHFWPNLKHGADAVFIEWLEEKMASQEST